jgi:hypothetical protein
MRLGADDPLRRLMMAEALRRHDARSTIIGAVAKPRIFVSYHHAVDRPYYQALTTTFCDQYDVVYDNSPERRIDSDNTDYVRQRLYDKHIKGSSCTLVLVGWATWGRKYIDWEIDATLQKEHGLIGVRLPTAPVAWNGQVEMPGRLGDNIQSGYALWITWEQLIQSPAVLTNSIEQAERTPRILIYNNRARRHRNV